MTHSTDIQTLARWMASDFSNQAQAIENPPFFAHIRVCMRPLPWELMDGASFYLEQAYDFALDQPYRSRVLRLIEVDGHIEIENYAIANGEELYGASREPERLKELARDRVELMCKCNFVVHWTGTMFAGGVEPGKGCLVTRKGKETYLDSTFEIDANHFSSHDTGRDIVTDEQLWGAKAGPFEFERVASFADEVILP
ncbi:MAG: chromophore lyase CpcT/CpeT [Cyanobacteria bacterium P01_H01_bin.130]